MLSKQIERLEAMNMSSYFASELEFYLFDEIYDPPSTRAASAQDHRQLHPGLSHLPDHQGGRGDARDPERTHRPGIPVENSKGEWGPGQEEINVSYADALTMADRHVVIKNACKEIAHLLRARR